MGDAASKILGQPVIIENKPGASGNLGMQELLRAPADGHTLAMSLMPGPGRTTRLNFTARF